MKKMTVTMSRQLVISAFGALALITAMAANVQARSAPQSFADLVEDLQPAVVNISTVQTVESGDRVIPQLPPGSPFEEFFEEFFNRQAPRDDAPPRRMTSLGSGFFIDPEGYIVTNNHVIDDADEVTVRMIDGEEFEATVIGRDEATDLALLKVDADQEFPFVEWGNPDEMRVGDWVLTIGNPFGLGGSVTAGIISAFHRDLQAGNYDDFIQTDASINRGNSGGPMFNTNGRVIGVNTIIFSPNGGNIGIGFAIPADLANRVVNSLKVYGYNRRGFLGVQIQAVTDEVANALGLEEDEGALISSVNEGGPADTAGLQPGDIIIRWDSKTVEGSRELARLVADTEIGKEVDVIYLRQGERLRTTVTTAEFPRQTEVAAVAEPEVAEPTSSSFLGMDLSDLSAPARQQYELPSNVDGVIISGIEVRSEAARRGLRRGDVIVAVNQVNIDEPNQIEAIVTDAEQQGRTAVLLRVYRDGNFFHIALPLTSEG